MLWNLELYYSNKGLKNFNKHPKLNCNVEIREILQLNFSDVMHRFYAPKGSAVMSRLVKARCCTYS
jgi:hypothetical protein